MCQLTCPVPAWQIQNQTVPGVMGVSSWSEEPSNTHSLKQRESTGLLCKVQVALCHFGFWERIQSVPHLSKHVSIICSSSCVSCLEYVMLLRLWTLRETLVVTTGQLWLSVFQHRLPEMFQEDFKLKNKSLPSQTSTSADSIHVYLKTKHFYNFKLHCIVFKLKLQTLHLLALYIS